MKKRGLLALAAAVALLSASALQAAEKKSAAGGLELSGNADVVTGWQHDTSNAGGAISGVNAADDAGSGEGQLGDFRGVGAPHRDTFNFYIDQVELDINKTFGENIRIRADLDFGRLLSGSGRNTAGTNFQLEQGYITANIPIGNGVEFLAGRFNTPIGLEAVDRADNIALSFTNIYRFLRPHNTTGVKVYYAFNDRFDWHLYVVNNLFDTIGNDTPIPSYGTRLGFTWGEKGKESVVGFSYAGGPEAAVIGNNQMAHLTHIGDIDFSFHLTDALLLAGEGIYRQDNNGGACPTTAVAAAPGNAGKNCKAFGGDLVLAYNFNETWGGWFRYEYMHDFQGNYTAIDEQIHDFSLGASYQITEGAKLKMEYRLDLALPAGPVSTALNHGFALEFAYNF
jgi:putative OmpL-like beta-barrel porin-2